MMWNVEHVYNCMEKPFINPKIKTSIKTNLQANILQKLLNFGYTRPNRREYVQSFVFILFYYHSWLSLDIRLQLSLSMPCHPIFIDHTKFQILELLFISDGRGMP